MADQLSIMRDERVPKALVRLAIPSILSALVGVVYNIVDTYFISLLNNPAMIAATTVALPLSMIVQSFGDGLGVGAGSYLGRLYGERQYEKAYVGLCTAITLGLVISILSSGTMMLFLRQILPLFNIADDVIQYTYDYMIILLAGGVALLFKQMLSNVLRAQGLVRWPMIAIIMGIILNVILDPIFMFDFGLGLGIKGAAYATILAWIVSALMMFGVLCMKHNSQRWKPFDFKFNLEAIHNISTIGLAAFVRQILPSFSITFLIRAASVYGTALVAAMGISKKSLRLITAVFAGYAHALQPFFAYNYGAKNRQRIEQALSISRIFVLVTGLFTSFIFYFAGYYIVRLFGADQQVIQYGINMLKGYALSLPVLGIYHVYAATLQAFGKSRASMILSSSRQGLFYIPVVLIVPRLVGELGIYLAQPLSDWMTFFLLIYLCRNLPKEIAALKPVEG